MRRLLLVDDSRAVRDALHTALDPYGFELVDAENGAIALQHLGAAHFDLAFVDLNMPVLDGPALVRMMRARGMATKVVLVTSGADTTVVAGAIKAGASDYVQKPFTPEQIRDVAAKVLGLDPGEWVESPADVIVQHSNPWVAGRLRGIVPARVRLHASDTLAKTLELAESKRPALVLLDEEVLEGDVVAAAEVVRNVVPGTAIFALSDNATKDRAWKPDGPLDGHLPLLMAEPVVRGFLYPIFLRPLVFGAGSGTLRCAGFEGEAAFHDAYFSALGRTILDIAAREDLRRDLAIDLTRVPPWEPRIAALVALLREKLDAQGHAPTFRVPRALIAPLKRHPELARALITGPA
ncbi:MAG: response regulator [Anaeromyxobacter sp.]